MQGIFRGAEDHSRSSGDRTRREVFAGGPRVGIVTNVVSRGNHEARADNGHAIPGRGVENR
jgi:hypothetical protein